MRDRLQKVQTNNNVSGTEKKHVMQLVEGYLQSRGLIPLSA